MDVAISELRANLKSYVDRARAGERVIVTERGVPVARLGPAEEESLLDRLEREGVLTRAKAKKRPIARKGTRIKAEGPVADLVSEQRADRDARVLG
jgi:prevent-host-death family protein